MGSACAVRVRRHRVHRARLPTDRDTRVPAAGPGCGSGLRIGADVAAGEVERADTLVVPGASAVDGFLRAPGAVGQVAALAAVSGRVAAVCTGAFALAAAGLLRGRRATTHWEHAAELARRFPDVAVTPDAIYVQDGPVFTSAGVTAGIDVCLALVEQDRGPEEARRVARDLVVFLQRPGGQSQFSAASRTPPTRHPVVRPLLDAVVADPSADHSVSDWLSDPQCCSGMRADRLRALVLNGGTASPRGTSLRTLVDAVLRPHRGGCPTSPGRRACA
ncbi:DJ-1/PfpI family protein [Streptomyces sp. ISL-96]|uniref:GlxA family transcriptional regulator n=1 Tax=Streptomyces sp. ISL-96 TaxID=2819191 RepID=UPI001BE73823|nr:DJ-1/PfpI family protein [Streptomyces sp. ISL-96]MBT2491262.1 DJ-1/PfpI family protein [Streptomyces sp. ISL-96]